MFDMYMVTERTTEAPIPSSEMELLAPTLGAENLEEDVEPRVSISKPVIPTREMPELVADERPSQDSMALESTAEVSLPQDVAFEVAMEEPPIQELVALESGVEEAPPQTNMAQEHGVIPPAIVPEATTLVASRAVPEVSATNLLRE